MPLDERTRASQTPWADLLRGIPISWRDFSLAGEQFAARRVFTPGLHLIVPVLAVLSALVGYLAFPAARGTDSWGLFLGTLAIVSMSWTFILASRLNVVHALFGGFDRSYIWHRWFAIVAVVALLFHADADNDARVALLPFGENLEDIGKDLAEVAEILVIALIMLSILRALPYGLWKLTHKLMIIPYAFSCFHFITAETTFPWASGWGLWFGLIMAAGMLSYLYRLLWVDLALSDFRYRVSRLETTADTFTGLHLTPVGRRHLRARAGQFAFVRSSVSPWAEPHPFSIASTPTDADLSFFARVAGDWSATLGSSLAVGDLVTVSGPHGNLEVVAGRDRAHIWVAAGSGITPFLSVGDALATLATPPRLIYSFRGAATAIGLDTVRAWRDRGLIDLIEHDSGTRGRLTMGTVHDLIAGDLAAGTPPRRLHVAVCGPFELIRGVQKTARGLGIRSVDFEVYDYRSGYGPNLTPVTQAVLDRLTAALRR